jgi:hypothetical protein
MCFVCWWRRTPAGGGYSACDPKAANSSAAAADTSLDSVCKFHWSFVCMRVEQEREIPQCGSSHHLCIHPSESQSHGFPMHPFFISSTHQSADLFLELTDVFHIPLLSRKFCLVIIFAAFYQL